MPTPEELRTWREGAVAAGNADDVARIDSELAKVQPLNDYTPLMEAYSDLKTAKEQGAPKDVIDSIQAHIDDFDRKMDLAKRRSEVEQMGAPERFVQGVGAGLKNVWEHTKELGHQIAYPGGQEVGWGPFQEVLRTGQQVNQPHPGEEAYWAQRQAEREKFNQENLPLQGTTSGFLGNVAGEALGTAPIALATAPAGTVLGSTLAGAGIGGLMAEPGERGAGAAWGGGIGALTGAGQKATEWVARPGFKISPAARKLKELNVEGMTGGQMAPQSSVAQIEQIAENTPSGAIVKARRQIFPYNLQERMLQEAHPPGFQSQLPPGASTFDKLREIEGEFHNRYNSLLDTQPVTKNEVQTDLLKHAYGPSKFALTPSQRKLAVDIITDQAGKLDDVNNMRTLADIKSGLQAEQRSLARTDPRLAKHIGDAVKIADSHIESGMKADINPNNYADYKALGRAYRNFIVLDKSATKDMATDTILTPDAVSRSLYRNMTPKQFARGEGGTLRELAQAGKQVLSERPGTKTGASLNLLNAIPSIGPIDMGPWVIGRMGQFSTSHPNLMLGQTAPQRVLQYTLAHPVVGGAVNQGLRTAVLHFLRGQSGADEELGPEMPQSAQKGP